VKKDEKKSVPKPAKKEEKNAAPKTEKKDEKKNVTKGKVTKKTEPKPDDPVKEAEKNAKIV